MTVDVDAPEQKLYINETEFKKIIKKIIHI